MQSAAWSTSAARARRLAYFVHGRGRGHASRAHSLLPALERAGYQLQLFASGEAHSVLRAQYAVAERPLLRRGPRGWFELWQRAEREALLLRRLGIDAVLSDGDQAALLGAARAHVPALALGHDLVFHHCALPRELRRDQLWWSRMNSLLPARLSALRVAVNFLPTHALDARTRVARPELSSATARAAQPRTRVVCYFRDRNGARVCAALRALGVELVVATAMAPAAFRAALAEALCAVGSAGSNLMAECVLLGVPLLALYREAEVEQALNARWLALSGAGDAASFERVRTAQLASFVQRARAGAFAKVPLYDALPSFVDVTIASLGELVSR